MERNFRMFRYFSELKIVLWAVRISEDQSVEMVPIMSLVTTKIVNNGIFITVVLSLSHGIFYPLPPKTRPRSPFFWFFQRSQSMSLLCLISLPKGDLMSLNTFRRLFWNDFHFFATKLLSEVLRSFKMTSFSPMGLYNWKWLKSVIFHDFSNYF